MSEPERRTPLATACSWGTALGLAASLLGCSTELPVSSEHSTGLPVPGDAVSTTLVDPPPRDASSAVDAGDLGALDGDLAGDAVGDAVADLGDQPMASNWDADWDAQLDVTFDNASRGQLDDFPVMVRLDPTRIDYARTPTGVDLRFVNPANSNQYPHEIEVWDPAGESIVWVRVKRIDADSTDNVMRIYYDNPDAALDDRRDQVWSNGYVSVYHMNLSLGDSAAANHGTTDSVDAAPAPSVGLLGGAQAFDGGGDYIVLPNETDFDFAGAFSAMVVFRVGQLDLTSQTLVAKGNTAWSLERDGSGNDLGFRTTQNDLVTIDTTQDDTLSIDNSDWHIVQVVFDSDAGEKRLHLDGGNAALSAFTGPVNVNDQPVWIGNNVDQPGRYWEGDIDEVRIADRARSPDWVSAQFSSLSDTFIVWP